MSKTKPKKPDEEMPLKVESEGKAFVVVMAISRHRLLDFLRKDTVSQGVISVRRINDEDRGLLESIAQDEEEEDKESTFPSSTPRGVSARNVAYFQD